MAIFASTTTSGYSDPMKAMSIKALEQRQRDMLQQQAQQPQAFTPENTQTPIQGFAQVANTAVDAMRQNRVEQAAAAQRAELAKAMAGGDPLNPSPQALATMAVAAPDMYKDVLGVIADRRKQQELFGQQDKARGEDARLAQEAAKEQEARIGLRPKSDVGNVKADVQSGKLTPEEGAAAIKKLTSAPASEQKYITGLQEQSVAGQSLTGLLDEALALTYHPKGIHTGGGAGMIQGIGESVPKRLRDSGIGSGVLPDAETTANTQRFNQIMGEQALALLTQMKGASSDRDVQVNFKIVNDPSATLENKRTAIRWLQAKAASLLQTHNDAITEAGGKVPTMQRPGGAAAPAATGGGGPAAATPTATASVPRPAGKNDSELIQEAKDAIAAHPEKKAAIEAQLQKWMMGN